MGEACYDTEPDPTSCIFTGTLIQYDPGMTLPTSNATGSNIRTLVVPACKGQFAFSAKVTSGDN